MNGSVSTQSFELIGGGETGRILPFSNLSLPDSIPGGGPSFPVASDLSLRFGIAAVVFLCLALPCCVVVLDSEFGSTHDAVKAALAARPSYVTRLLLSRLPAWPLAISAHVLPFLFLGAWAAAIYPAEPPQCWVYGLGVLLGGSAGLLAAYALLAWRQRCWAVSGRIIIAGAASLLLLLLLQVLLVAQRPWCAATPKLAEFPHTAATAIAMALNLIPLSSILYLNLNRTAVEHHAPIIRADELKRSTACALVMLGVRRATWPRLQAVLMYSLSLAMLVLYSVMFFFATPSVTPLPGVGGGGGGNSSSGGGGAVAATEGISGGVVITRLNPYAGLFASLTVVLLDVEVGLYALGQALPMPLTPASAPTRPLACVVRATRL